MKKRTQFFNTLYVGEDAEYKPTSVRLPVGFINDISELAERSGKTQSAILQEFIYKGFCNELAEERGDMLLHVGNPQLVKEPSEITRAETLKMLSELAALRTDKRIGFKTGIIDIMNFIYKRLCEENNGVEWTGNIEIMTPAEELKRANVKALRGEKNDK